MGLKILPEKVFMKAAIVAFDLTDHSTLQATEFVLMHTNDKSLNLYCDNEITGIEVSEDVGEIFDNNGNFIDFKTAPDEEMKTFLGAKIIVNAHAYAIGSRVLISADRFSQDNIDYFIPDETGAKIIDATFNYNDFYFNREELLNYIEIQTKNKNNTTKNTTSAKKGKEKIQTRRESALKSWLAGKAGIEITDKSKFQDCYLNIGSPIQEELWSDLQKTDKHLFSAGRDDFFKKQKIIKFKLGSGKGRSHKKP